MSKNTCEPNDNSNHVIKIDQSDNSSDDFKKPLPAFRYNKFLRPSSFHNKNGFSEKNIKRETSHINHFESNSGEKISQLKNIQNNHICIFCQNDKQSLSNYSTNFQINYLEPRDNNFFQLGEFSTIPDSKMFLYNKYKHNLLNNHHFSIYPLISKVFTQNKNMANNNICSNMKRFLNKKYKSKSHKSHSSKNNSKAKRNFINIANFKLENCQIDELYINFIIPENFLIDFNIKDIIIKNLENNTKKEKKPPFISLKETEIFLNNLCKNVIINKEGESNFFFNGEFVEYKSFVVKIGELFFIEKKPKTILDNDECNCINHNLSDDGKRNSKRNNFPLKNKNKKNNKKIIAKIKNEIKLKNQKNGEKIIGYLNQFKINKSSLENFPLFPSLNIERIIYVKEILRSIIENEIIGFNEKVKFINDKRNEKYIINKRFEIIYQNQGKNAQYILYLNEFNILYLIFFYYYQIKEGLTSINHKFIGHRSKEEIILAKNNVEILINKCNKIVKKITN